MDQKKKKICIWGTSFLIEEGLKSLLGSTGRYSLTGISGNFEQLIKAVGHYEPDVLIIDAASGGLMEAEIGALKNITRSTVVLMLLEAVSRIEFQRYSEAGIENLLLKSASGHEILSAAESAVEKRKYYSGEILDMILESIESKHIVGSADQLTPSEKEIVLSIAGGLTTKEIASRRNISFHTVNTHRKNIFRKLNINSSSELIMKAIKAGWIDNIEYYI